MDWSNALNDIVGRYTGQGGGTAAAPENAHEDFQRVAQAAPGNVVGDGITQAFRSDQTPPFAEMVSKLFSQSDPSQRAGLLNRLLSSLGPGAVASLPGLGSLSGILGGGQVTEQQAAQVAPEQVQQIAAHAERQDPTIVDQVGHFYSQHPDVMKAVGGMALAIALQHILKRR